MKTPSRKKLMALIDQLDDVQAIAVMGYPRPWRRKDRRHLAAACERMLSPDYVSLKQSMERLATFLQRLAK